MKILKYTGNGIRFVPGIPARDLTAQETENLSKEMKKTAINSGAYVEVDEKSKQKEAVNG